VCACIEGTARPVTRYTPIIQIEPSNIDHPEERGTSNETEETNAETLPSTPTVARKISLPDDSRSPATRSGSPSSDIISPSGSVRVNASSQTSTDNTLASGMEVENDRTKGKPEHEEGWLDEIVRETGAWEGAISASAITRLRRVHSDIEGVRSQKPRKQGTFKHIILRKWNVELTRMQAQDPLPQQIQTCLARVQHTASRRY
jgi:hypothetical protein